MGSLVDKQRDGKIQYFTLLYFLAQVGDNHSYL